MVVPVGVPGAFASSVRVQDARDDDERVVALVALAHESPPDGHEHAPRGDAKMRKFARRHRAEERVRAEPSDHRVVERRRGHRRVARVRS